MAFTGLMEDVEPNKTEKAKNPGRRVNFPNDDSLISKVFEAQDPWKDAHRATNEDLVNGYKRSCEKWNVKPIAKVLQQLEEIHDFSKRSEYLNLKGEKLDGKTCETLEEVFRRVRFHLVDLQSIITDDEALIALFEMLEYYESAVRLSLAFSRNFNARGWQAISRLLKKSHSLEQLDLRGASIPDNCIPFLTRPIRQGTSLSVLHMENCEMSGRLCLMLCSAMKANMSIRNLFLGDNKLNPVDAQQIGNLLRANHRLKLLDLRNNCIQDAGLVHIAEGLTEQLREEGLLILVLWNNQLTHHSMDDLAGSLTVVTNLETLNIGCNALGNPGILKLKEGLLKNQSVLRLGLMDIKINCEGAVALAEYLGDNNRMVRLDVRKNDIKTAGLMALSLSLKVHNRSVLRLDLDTNVKKEPFKGYEETQRQLQEQIYQSCERNKELAKNQEMRDQVLEQQKLEETKTMLRSASVDGGHGVEGHRSSQEMQAMLRSVSIDEYTAGGHGVEGQGPSDPTRGQIPESQNSPKDEYTARGHGSEIPESQDSSGERSARGQAAEGSKSEFSTPDLVGEGHGSSSNDVPGRRESARDTLGDRELAAGRESGLSPGELPAASSTSAPPSTATAPCRPREEAASQQSGILATAVSQPETPPQAPAESTGPVLSGSGPSERGGETSGSDSGATPEDSTLGGQGSEGHPLGQGPSLPNGMVPQLLTGCGDSGGMPIPDKSQGSPDNQGLSSSPDDFEKELDQMLANATGESLGINTTNENVMS